MSSPPTPPPPEYVPPPPDDIPLPPEDIAPPPPDYVPPPPPEDIPLNSPAPPSEVSIITPTEEKRKVITSSEEIPFQPPPPKDTPTPTKEENKEYHEENVNALIERNALFRLDVLPFLFLYPTYIYLDISEEYSNEYSHLILSTLFPITLTLHIILFLIQQWRITIKCIVGYKKSKNDSSWSNNCHALVNNEAIVSMHKSADDTTYVCTHNDIVYRYNSLKSCFYRLLYPVDWTLSQYTNWKGHTHKSIVSYRHMYGYNKTSIQTPSLWILLHDQLLAPFFLFQVFCVLLWSLDEYWYYAIFTLCTLVIFECTIAFNRRKSLQRLRDTLKGSYNIPVYRYGEWEYVSTEHLIAGDIVCLLSDDNSKEDVVVPCDILLLSDDKQGASSVLVNEAMLTGESVPQIKEPLEYEMSQVNNVLDIDDQHYKKNLIFGGTTILNISSSSSDANSNATQNCNNNNIPSPFKQQQDNYALGFVLRTGFETQQGQLLRTMIHSHTNNKKFGADGVNTSDTFVFIFMLLICAIIAATAVLKHGWDDPTRNKFKLLLHVIIIITSVVPPELPMELSLAVTSSLSDLIKYSVFCTEPFRIPLAGKVTICCFDKTGTLTSDELRVRGLRLIIDDDENDNKIYCNDVSTEHGSNDDLISTLDDDIPIDTLRVMVSCQTLALGKDKSTIVGDPLDKVMITSCDWKLLKQNIAIPNNTDDDDNHAVKDNSSIQILHKWPFESRFKRMTSIIQHNNQENKTNTKKYAVVSKGAPEIIKTMLSTNSIPSNYDKVYRYHMSLGQRVLALGHKTIKQSSVSSLSVIQSNGRDYYEKDLNFAGFLILDCPLKSDTFHIINELKVSSHKVVMITGDSALTAAEVSRQVGIIDTSPKDTYELREMKLKSKTTNGGSVNNSVFAFVPISAIQGEYTPEQTIAFVPGNIPTLQKLISKSELSFAISGDVMTKVAISAIAQAIQGSGALPPSLEEKQLFSNPHAQQMLQSLVPLITIFARHSPTQKEAVIHALNQCGNTTLMCGDGTNDVGALKHAHVGISIISTPHLEAKERKTKEGLAYFRNKKKSSKKTKSAERSLMKELAETEDELNYVSLGDASVASPFTSRSMSITCCKHVIQQGRCTLVTMIQIYKILGVNCLVNALMLSYLHMHGVKQGDRQMTAIGLVVAVLFFFVTKGKPLSSLSIKRPPSSILSTEALLSISFQFIIHWFFIMVITHISLPFLDPDDPGIIPDGSYNPNALNSCTFLMLCLTTCNTFIVNYRGRPFMQGLKENKLLLRALQVCIALIFICALEAFEPLNQLLQLSVLPDADSFTELLVVNNNYQMDPVLFQIMETIGFKGVLCNVMFLDCFFTYQVENQIVKKLFS